MIITYIIYVSTLLWLLDAKATINFISVSMLNETVVL